MLDPWIIEEIRRREEEERRQREEQLPRLEIHIETPVSPDRDRGERGERRDNGRPKPERGIAIIDLLS